MSETKTKIQHTPGPWVIEKRVCNQTASVHYSIVTRDKQPETPWSPRFVCWMNGSLGEQLPNRKMEEYRNDPDIEADAGLIAAAPELLEALKALLETTPMHGAYPAMARAQEKADAAIAKAEGRT